MLSPLSCLQPHRSLVQRVWQLKKSVHSCAQSLFKRCYTLVVRSPIPHVGGPVLLPQNLQKKLQAIHSPTDAPTWEDNCRLQVKELLKSCTADEKKAYKAYEKWVASIYLHQYPVDRHPRRTALRAGIYTILTYLRSIIIFLGSVCFLQPSLIAGKAKTYFAIFENMRHLTYAITTMGFLLYRLYKASYTIASTIVLKPYPLLTLGIALALATLLGWLIRLLLRMPPARLSRTDNITNECSPQIYRPRYRNIEHVGKICHALKNSRCVVVRDAPGEGKTYRVNLLAKMIRYHRHFLPKELWHCSLYRINGKYVANEPLQLAETLSMIAKQLGPAQKRSILVCDEGHNLFKTNAMYRLFLNFLRTCQCRVILTTTHEDSNDFYTRFCQGITPETPPSPPKQQSAIYQWAWIGNEQPMRPRAISIDIIHNASALRRMAPENVKAVNTILQQHKKSHVTGRGAQIAIEKIRAQTLSPEKEQLLARCTQKLTTAAHDALTKRQPTSFLALLHTLGIENVLPTSL